VCGEPPPEEVKDDEGFKDGAHRRFDVVRCGFVAHQLTHTSSGCPPSIEDSTRGAKQVDRQAAAQQDLQQPTLNRASLRLLLGELTSLSFGNRVVCTQEGRKKVHTGVLSFDVSHSLNRATRRFSVVGCGSHPQERWMRAPGHLGGDEQRLARHGVDRLAHAHLRTPEAANCLGFEMRLGLQRAGERAETHAPGCGS
jgi:hypothetical protein